MDVSKGASKSQSFSSIQVPTSWPTSETDPQDELENPKEASDWKQVTVPTEIQFLIQLRNRLHFGQASTDKTPFTQPPLSSQLNWSASTGTADLILEGNYTNGDLDTITTLFLDNCTRVTALDSLPLQITLSLIHI